MVQSLNEPQLVQLALQFGWTFAEVAGRLTQEDLQWHPNPHRPRRLFLSHPNPTTGESLAVALQQLLALGAQLFPTTEKQPSVCPPPAYLAQTLPEHIADWQTGKAPDLKVDDVFIQLDIWSRECWIQLGVKSPVLQTAAKLGAQLGDTYWQMQITREGKAPVNKESWRYFLSAERTYRLIEDVRQVEPYLPDTVGALLRHSLWEWGIADDLGRKSNQALHIAHPVHWARLKKRHADALKDLQPDEEKGLKENLESQRRLWGDLISGRSILLRPKAMRAVRRLTGVIFVLLAVLLGASTVVGLTVVLALAVRLALWLFPLIAPTAEIKDWLAIGGAVVSAVSFLGPLLWRWSRWIGGLHEGIEKWGQLAMLKRLTLHRWDGRCKAFLLIAWQQLIYPDAR